jgi:hypothetical protein
MAPQRTDRHRAGDAQSLLGRPQRIFALAGTRHDQLREVQPELRQPRRIRRTIFSERALFTGPDNSGRSRPLSRERER